MLRGTRPPPDQFTLKNDPSNGRIAWLTYLPLPPSINEAYINRSGFSGPGRVKSAKYRLFEELMFQWKLHNTAEVSDAEEVARGKMWLQVDVWFCFPRKRIITREGLPKRHDLDNRLKVLNDAVADVVGFNDCRIAGQRIEKCETKREDAYVSVAISVRPGLVPPPL